MILNFWPYYFYLPSAEAALRIVSWVAENVTQDFVHASQEFYQLNYIPASLGLLV